MIIFWLEFQKKAQRSADKIIMHIVTTYVSAIPLSYLSNEKNLSKLFDQSSFIRRLLLAITFDSLSLAFFQHTKTCMSLPPSLIPIAEIPQLFFNH